MGGSFESGAGDDPNDLFASDDDADEEEVTEEADVQLEQADDTEAEEQDTAAAASGESEAAGASTRPTREEDTPSEPGSVVMLDIESPAELDAVRLAREFVPNT